MTLYSAKSIHVDELLFRFAFYFIDLDLHRWAPCNSVHLVQMQELNLPSQTLYSENSEKRGKERM